MVILTIGFVTALNCLTAAVLWDAIYSTTSGLSENATQIITGAFGGILGVLGTFLGIKHGERSSHEPPIDHTDPSVITSQAEAPDPDNRHP